MKKIVLLIIVAVLATGCKQFTCVECQASADYNTSGMDFCGKDRHREAEKFKSDMAENGISITCMDK